MSWMSSVSNIRGLHENSIEEYFRMAVLIVEKRRAVRRDTRRRCRTPGRLKGQLVRRLRGWIFQRFLGWNGSRIRRMERRVTGCRDGKVIG